MSLVAWSTIRLTGGACLHKWLSGLSLLSHSMCWAIQTIAVVQGSTHVDSRLGHW